MNKWIEAKQNEATLVSLESFLSAFLLSLIYFFIAHVLFVTSSVESSAVIKKVSTSHISHLPFFSDSTELLCIFCIIKDWGVDHDFILDRDKWRKF